MTDQRTLKRIIGEQRGIIEKQKVVIDELNENYLKLSANFNVSDNLLGEANEELERYKEENYDMLYIEAFLREDLADLRKQIEEANKILDGPIYGPNNTCSDLVKRLKECLAINCEKQTGSTK